MNPTPATLRAIEWLDERLAELRDIRNATSRDPIFKNWRQGTVTVLQRIWPADAQRVERFRRIPFSPADPRADARAVREAFGRGCQEATRVLKGFVEDLRAHGAPDAPASAPEVGTSDFEDGFPTMDLPAGDVTRSSEPPLLPGDLFGDMGDLPPTLADGSAPPRLQVTVPTPPLAATAPAPSAGADSPAPPAPSASVPVVPPVSEPPGTTPNEVAAAEVPTPSPASDASVVAGAPAKRTNGSRWRLRDLLGFAQLSARTLAGLPAEGADAAVAAVPPAAPATPANPTTPAAAATPVTPVTPVTPATPAAPEATAPSAAPTAPETTAPSVAPVASSVPATSDPVVEPAAPVVAEVVPLEAAVPVTPATPVSASSDAAVPVASAVTTPEIASPVVAPSSSEVPVPGTSSSAAAPPSAAAASVSPRTVVETPESIVTHTTTLRAPIEKVGMDALVSPELRQAEPVEPTPVAAQAAPDVTPNPAAPEVVASTESVAPTTEVAAVAQSVAEEVTPTTEVAAAAPPVAEESTPTTEVAAVAPPVAEAPKPAARSGKRRSRSSNARVTRLDDPEFNVDPTPSASLPRPSSEMPVPHLVPSASRPAPDPTEEPAPPVERTPKHARLEPVSQAPTDDTGTRVDPDEFAIAADDFVRTSPVLGAAGRRVARRADANEFTDPDAIAVASLVDDLGELGVPAGRHAEMRARLLDLARRIEHGTLDWSVLRKAMWFAMEHPELARRVVPVLLPWMDRAA